MKVLNLDSHCRPINSLCNMHTCLIISLHGVGLFFVIIECTDKYHARRRNNGKSSKLHDARGTTVRYHGCVACPEDITRHLTWRTKTRHFEGIGQSSLRLYIQINGSHALGPEQGCTMKREVDVASPVCGPSSP